ncbi:unnamed protein product [Withania somnifera]
MAKLSSTLCLFLFLVFAAGAMVVANAQCRSNLGICGDLCDTQCCERNCFTNFKTRNPMAFCEKVPGSQVRFCNCYYYCE